MATPRISNLGITGLFLTFVVAIGLSTARSHAQGSLCAEGGGSITNDEWAKPAFEWMMNQARPLALTEGGGVRVVVLGSRDEHRPADPIEEPLEGQDLTLDRFNDAGAADIRSYYINAQNAADPQIIDAIRRAHIIWMRGGSQTRYTTFWKDSPVESGIRAVFVRGGVIGGTSAGCAVLGEFVYDAAGGSCDANTALRNPYAKEVSFTKDFLGLAPDVLFDSHFTERARIARLAVFLGRIRSDFGRDALGIGLDSRTALCIAPDGAAHVVGTGAACFMRLTPRSRVTIERTTGDWPIPPAVSDIDVRAIVAGETINVRTLAADLATAESLAHDAATWRVASGSFRKEADPQGSGFVRGDATAHATRGQVYLSPDLPARAFFYGNLALSPGTRELPGAVVATRSLLLKERIQNSAGGVLWALANTDARWGSFLDAGAALRLTDAGALRAYFPHGKLGAAMSAPVFVKTPEFKPGARPPTERMAYAFAGIRMHLLAPGWSFDPATADAYPPAAQEPSVAPHE